jgi:hypothetical protein
MPKKKNHSTPEQDKERFIAAARELGCDISEDEFAEAIKKLAQAKPTSKDDVKRMAKKKPKA